MKTTKLSKGDPIELSFSLKAEESEDGVFSAAITNETVVENWGQPIRLMHTPDAIDLSRASDNGLIMLWSHDQRDPIGRIHNVRLDADKVMRGDFHFSSHESADRYRAQVADGTLTDVSVGADILEFEEDPDNEDIVNITRWRPYEASLVSIGRIPTAKIGFSHTQEDELMSDDDKTATDQGGNKTAAQVIASKQRENAAEQGKGANAERDRQKAIRGLFSKPAYSSDEYQELMNFCLDEGLTLAQAQAELLDYIGLTDEQKAPATAPYATTRSEPQVNFKQDSMGRRHQIQMGATNDEKRYDAYVQAVSQRFGILEANADTAGNDLIGRPLGELARAFARDTGMKGVEYADTDRIVRALFDRNIGARLNVGFDIQAQHSTSDFPGVLANAIDKQIVVNYEQVQETWRSVARVSSVADFKQASRPAMSAFEDLLEIPEGGEYKHGSLSDVVEYLTASKFGRIVSLTREMIINDDIQAFSDLSMKMAMAAARKVGDDVWSIYTSNPTLNQDSTAVFDASHGNIGTAGAPSTTTLSEARRLMRTQTDPSGNATLGLTPALLIVPPIWETEARALVGAEQLDYEVRGSTDSTDIVSKRAANQWSNLAVVVEDRLGGTAGTDNDWFLQANPTAPVPFIDVAFVRGQQAPQIDTREGWTVDGIEYKVRMEYGTTALAYQPVVRNAGS